MFSKKVWIPILIILLAAIGCGLLYRQNGTEQAPIKAYKPAEVQQIAHQKPPPPGETAESGHWHGDVWHAVSDTIEESVLVEPLAPQVPVGQVAAFLQDVSTTYPPLETTEAVEEFLNTASSDEIYVRTRDMYIARHYKKHPNCTEYEAVLADSLRFASYFLADREYMRKSQELSDQWEAVSSELDNFYNSIINMSESEGLQFIENMSDSEKQAFKDLDERRQAAYERLKAFRSQKPASPEPAHTH